jgi:hypothetical protein
VADDDVAHHDPTDRPRGKSEASVVSRQVTLESLIEADTVKEVIDDGQTAEPFAFELEGSVAWRHVCHRI